MSDIERMSDVRVARKPNVRIASPGTRTRGVVPKNSAVIFLPITALFYSPKKIKIVSILASKYLSMYPLSDGRLFTPCDLVYNLASFLNPLWREWSCLLPKTLNYITTARRFQQEPSVLRVVIRCQIPPEPSLGPIFDFSSKHIGQFRGNSGQGIEIYD